MKTQNAKNNAKNWTNFSQKLENPFLQMLLYWVLSNVFTPTRKTLDF